MKKWRKLCLESSKYTSNPSLPACNRSKIEKKCCKIQWHSHLSATVPSLSQPLCGLPKCCFNLCLTALQQLPLYNIQFCIIPIKGGCFREVPLHPSGEWIYIQGRQLSKLILPPEKESMLKWKNLLSLVANSLSRAEEILYLTCPTSPISMRTSKKKLS